MKNLRQASLLAYLGIILILVGMSPALADKLDHSRLLHAIWHLWLFVGAAFFIYGMETIRWFAKRHHRMTT